VSDSTIHKFIRNTLFLYVSAFISQLCAFILLPIIVHKVGGANFGLYVLALSVPAFLAFLDFGMNGAVIKMVAPLDADKDRIAINEILSTVLMLRIVTGLLIAGVIWFMSFNVERYFKFKPEQIETVRALFRIIAVFAFVNWTLLIFRSVVFSRERFEIDTAAILTNSIAGFVLAVILVHVYGTVQAATCGLLSGQLMGNFVYYLGGRKVLPHLTIAPGYLSLGTMKRVFSFGGRLFISDICSSVLFQMDKMLLGVFKDVNSIAQYGIADTVHQFPRMVHLLSTNALMPAISNLEAKKEWAKIHDIILSVGRIVLCLVYPVTIYFIVFTEPFILWYVGPEFRPSILTARVYVCYWFLNAMTGVVGTSIIGTGRINFLVIYAIFLLVAKVALSILLVPRYGHLGAVSATTFAYMVFTPVFLYVGLRILEMSFLEYLYHVFLRHLIPVGITFIVAFGMARWLVCPMFTRLFIAAVIVFIAYQASFYFLVLRRGERLALRGYIGGLFKVQKKRLGEMFGGG